MKATFGKQYDSRLTSLCVIPRIYDVGLHFFGSSSSPIDLKQNLYNAFYIFAAPRGISHDGKYILPPNPHEMTPDTATILSYIFDTNLVEFQTPSTTNRDLIDDLKKEFPSIPGSATPSLEFALNLANYVISSGVEKTNQIVKRWNAVAEAIETHCQRRWVESFEPNGKRGRDDDDEDRRIRPRTSPASSPVDLPEIVRMIIARLPSRDKLRANRVNRTWNAMTTYTEYEKHTILHHAIKNNNTALALRLLDDPHFDPSAYETHAISAYKSDNEAIIYRLLQHPRVDPRGILAMAISGGRLALIDRILHNNQVDPSKPLTIFSIATGDDNEAIVIACESGQEAVVDRLLQDPRVDPSARDNEALIRACGNGHDAVVNRLLRDHRVDPSARDNEAIIRACDSGHLPVVDRLLRDHRVDPSTQNNLAILIASKYGHEAVVDRLLRDPRVDPSARNNTALLIALKREKQAVVDRLLQDPRVDQSYQFRSDLIRDAYVNYLGAEFE